VLCVRNPSFRVPSVIVVPLHASFLPSFPFLTYDRGLLRSRVHGMLMGAGLGSCTIESCPLIHVYMYSMLHSMHAIRSVRARLLRFPIRAGKFSRTQRTHVAGRRDKCRQAGSCFPLLALCSPPLGAWDFGNEAHIGHRRCVDEVRMQNICETFVSGCHSLPTREWLACRELITNATVAFA
jgi:hypothetical protein